MEFQRNLKHFKFRQCVPANTINNNLMFLKLIQTYTNSFWRQTSIVGWVKSFKQFSKDI